ncbi:MAG TPA: hypothetical protein VIO64_02585 [Pseudobacteroides sp.]|uniref:hypothetical protein n=1 Tax=Pseudobacteroides sp. TaxID=1968840 RepID=UPI002F91C66F
MWPRISTHDREGAGRNSCRIALLAIPYRRSVPNRVTGRTAALTDLNKQGIEVYFTQSNKFNLFYLVSSGGDK